MAFDEFMEDERSAKLLLSGEVIEDYNLYVSHLQFAEQSFLSGKTAFTTPEVESKQKALDVARTCFCLFDLAGCHKALASFWGV